MGKVKQEAMIQEALAGAGEILRAMGKNLDSIARRAERASDGRLTEASQGAELLKAYHVIRGVGSVLTGAGMTNDDSTDEINRNFKMIEDFLRGSGLLDEEFAGDPG